MLPRVVIHNEMSLDGRVEWLDVHMGLYYELAGRWMKDAALVGGSAAPFFRSPEPWRKEDMVKLRLVHVEELDDDVVWLRYDVVR